MNRTQIARLLLLASILYVIGFYFIGSAIKPKEIEDTHYLQMARFGSDSGYPLPGTADRLVNYNQINMLYLFEVQ